jgi:hypothetical protein
MQTASKQAYGEGKRYYDIVVACARKMNNPQITLDRVVKLVDLCKLKNPNCPEIDPKLLRQAWREFKRA